MSLPIHYLSRGDFSPQKLDPPGRRDASQCCPDEGEGFLECLQGDTTVAELAFVLVEVLLLGVDGPAGFAGEVEEGVTEGAVLTVT